MGRKCTKILTLVLLLFLFISQFLADYSNYASPTPWCCEYLTLSFLLSCPCPLHVPPPITVWIMMGIWFRLSKLDSLSWEFRIGNSEKASQFVCMPWIEGQEEIVDWRCRHLSSLAQRKHICIKIRRKQIHKEKKWQEIMGPREKLVSDDFLVSGYSPDEAWLSARRYYFVLITY